MAADVLRRLGQRVRELRTEHDFTQEGLAEKAGMSWHYISAIERGTKSATVETLTSIAGALDVTLSELFFGVDRALPRDVKRLTAAIAGLPHEHQRTILRMIDDVLKLRGR